MKNKYLYLFLISVIMMILSGCTLRTSDGFTSDEKSICVLQNGRSARIGNTVLYDCSEDYGTYIKLENSDVSRKLDDVSQNFSISKISSSNQYFYLSGKEISDVWGGKTNVLVMDVNGKIIAAKECCCDWIYASGSTIFGYYKCRDESEKVLAWEATRMEVTHYQDEEEFLNSEDNNIEEWTPMTGESLSVDGKEWFRQKKDYEHSQNYYTDTVYCDTYYVLEWLNYVDGRESSGLDWDVKVQSKKYIKQMRKLMGAKKNFEVSSWQLEDKLVVICRVYSRSGGLLQHFTKDIERSLIFQYDPDTDSLHLDNTYEGKELAYWDETWMIYRKGKELFVENIPTHKVSKVFENDTIINIDLSYDIVTLWDTKDGKLNRSDTFILQ